MVTFDIGRKDNSDLACVRWFLYCSSVILLERSVVGRCGTASCARGAVGRCDAVALPQSLNGLSVAKSDSNIFALMRSNRDGNKRQTWQLRCRNACRFQNRGEAIESHTYCGQLSIQSAQGPGQKQLDVAHDDCRSGWS